jgi:uncharacterized protein YaiL (DUF2058 family)
MTPEEKQKAAEQAKADKLAEEQKAAEQAKADKLAEEQKAAEQAKADKLAEEQKALSGTFIMTVGRLSWGLNEKNYFYADKKPLINAKVMGSYAKTLKVWLEAGWIKKGAYKK